MAQYNINFSTNASQIAKELSRVQTELAKTVQAAKPGGLKIKLSLDTADFTRAINSSFKELDQLISQAERKLRKAKIGSPEFKLAAAQSGQLSGERQRGQMMARAIGSRESAQAFDVGSLARYERALESLRIQAELIAPNTKEWVNLQQKIGEITLELRQADKAAESIQLTQQLGALAPGSLSRLEKQLTILKTKAREIAPDTLEWKKLNKEIQNVEGSIKKVSKKPLSAGQRAGAAGGAFLYGGGMGGGIGSAFGGIAGGLAGGVPGAFAGAAIGQVADNLGTALAGITSQAAAVQKMQRGLAMASVDAKDFAEAQAAVGEMSQKLLMPLEQTSKYFAQLRANTKEYNLSVAETREILEGTALAIMATGGSAEDLDGAMRAVVQIMSKGGVQAEELRGQLGERFPGAVVKFAQANKLSFEELQAGLEGGQIGIREFINFAKKNYTDYAKFSEQLATAPEYAGQRLKMAFEEMQLAIGRSFGASGATVQDTVTGWIKDITAFVTKNREYLQQMASDFAYIFKGIVFIVKGAAALIRGALMPVVKFIQGLIRDIRIAVNSAGAAQYKSKMSSIDAEIATAEKTGDVRAAGRIATLRKNRAEMEKLFRGAGGEAALSGEDFTYGGTGAGMSIDREEKENKTKTSNLEAFERLRDQLANAYNKAEIERIKAEYELRKRLQEDLYDMQEFGANRLQRQNLQFLRALAKAEQDRQDVAFSGQLEIAEAAGKVAPSAPVLPPAGGTGAGRLPGSIGGRLDASGQNGADMPVALNNIMRSYHNGIVTEINRAGNNGNYVVIEFLDDLGNKLEATYSHVAAAVKVGQSIVGGQTVGRFDASGRTFGAHNSIDINSPGTNGALQRNRESAAARRSADILVTGRVQGSVGAGAPRAKVGSNEIRDTMAGANTGIAQDNAALANRNAIIVKGSQVLKDLGRYMQEAYNVPDLDLDNRLLKARNDLTQEGLDENVINYKIRLLELDIQYQDLLKAFPGFANAAKLGEEDRVKILAILAQMFGKAKDAEKAKNDETLRGIEIEKKRERDKYIKSLQDEIKLLLIIGEEERKLAEIKAQYGEERAQEIFDLLAIKKNIEDTRALIDGFVSQTSSDYKGFLKAVISGEDAVDALKQFQEGLKDRVLTIFLDFAMAPVEKFIKEAMEGLLLPKTKKEAGVLPEATTKDPVEATNINTNATNTNTTELKNLTTAIQGMGAGTNAAPSVQGPTAGNAFYDGSALPSIAPSFDAASVFGNPEALTGAFANIQSSISASMEGISSSFQMGADSLASTLPSWSDSLTTAIPAALTTSTAKTNSEVPNFQESLGKVAAGIGIAAGSIMGIAAGISQIKEGGTSNVLGGIGSILTSVGGGMMGFMNLFGAANGAVWNGGFQAFANGGTVTGPTLGLIGEGKYNEAIVPLPDGRSIPVQMRGGSSRDLLNAPGSAPAAPTMLSMSFQSTTINGVEYVDRAQLEAAMAETRKSAARDGASRGASLALDKLQNSPSARRRIGIR